jgi:hypothetical protein
MLRLVHSKLLILRRSGRSVSRVSYARHSLGMVKSSRSVSGSRRIGSRASFDDAWPAYDDMPLIDCAVLMLHLLLEHGTRPVRSTRSYYRKHVTPLA